VFGEVLKSAPLDLIKAELSRLLAFVTSMGKIKTLNNNVMVRKLRTKIFTRVGLRVLPPNPNAGRRKGACKTFHFLMFQVVTLLHMSRSNLGW
jgi:hypothetical protein